MAISHVQPLLLLLATLFFLPFLRAVDFEYCNKSGYDFGNVTSVEISPDPILDIDVEPTITVKGYANKSLDYGSIEVSVTAGNITHGLRRYYLCIVGDSCAIEAGTNYVLPLFEVPQDILEGDLKYAVTLLDDSGPESEPSKVVMCVDFDFPNLSPPLVSA